MLQKHKLPSLEAGILLILLATAIVGAGFFTSGNKITGMTAMEGLGKIKAIGNEIKKTEASVFRPEELAPNSQVTGMLAGTEIAKGADNKIDEGSGNEITGEMARVAG